MRGWRGVGGAWLLGCALWSGCSWVNPPKSEADAAFEAGEVTRAVQGYGAFLASGQEPGQDRALYRLAILHGMQDSPVFDRGEVRRYCQLLVEKHPASPYSGPARMLLAYETQIQDLSAEKISVQRQVAELEEQLRLREQEARDVEAAAEQEEGRVETLSQEAELLRQEVNRLKKSLAESKKASARLGRELEELKKIDLRDPP